MFILADNTIALAALHSCNGDLTSNSSDEFLTNSAHTERGKKAENCNNYDGSFIERNELENGKNYNDDIPSNIEMMETDENTFILQYNENCFYEGNCI